MDLQIKINGEFVDLFPDTKIKYIFNSPAFGRDAIMGDISQVVNLPSTGKNHRIFSFLNRAETYSSIEQVYDCLVFSSGIKIVDGKFKLKKASIEGFRGNIVGGMSEVKELIGKKTLDEVDFGSDITLGGYDGAARQYLVDAAKGVYPDYRFVAPPIKNEEFYGTVEDNLYEASLFQMESIFSAWGFVNNFFSDKYSDLSGDVEHYGGAAYNVQAFCPLLYIKFIIDKLFEELSFTPDGEWYNDSEISTLLLNHLNCQNSSIFPLSSPPLSVSPSEMVPKESIQKFLVGLRNMWNIGFFPNYATRKIYIEPLKNLLTEDVIDWTDKASQLEEILAQELDDGYKMSFEFDSGDSIPSSFIKSLDGYNILSAVNSVALLPGSATLGDVRYVRYEAAYYIYANDEEGTPLWQRFSYPYQEYTEGDGKNIVKPNATPVPASVEYTTGYDQDVEDWVMVQYKAPLMNQVGNCPLVYNLSGNDFGFRLMFYRGLKTDSRGYYYPLASADDSDIHGVSTGNYSMRWDGEKGLYKVWWEDWHTFLDNAKETKWKLKLNITDILNLDFRKRIRIKSNLYFIKKLNIQFPFNGEADAEMIKITAAGMDISVSGSASSSSAAAGDFENTSPNDDFNNDFFNT